MNLVSSQDEVTYIPSREGTGYCHSDDQVPFLPRNQKSVVVFPPNFVIRGDISSFLSEEKSLFDVEHVLKELTTNEKIDLLAGKYSLNKSQFSIY